MVWGVLLAAALAAPAAESELRQAVVAVRGVGPNGQGSAAAAKAWPVLAAADADQLPVLLAGMDGASPLARNWLRAAIDPVMDRAAKGNQPLPAAALEAFLRDARHDPHARRLAYELVVKAEPAAADRLLPGLLDDPSPDLRRDAVARLLDLADKLLEDKKRDEAKPLYQRALAAARDRDQLDRTAKRLGELGQPVNLTDHLGFLRHWKAAGPFPNPEGKGIDTPYPPERGLDVAAEFDGKAGKVRWKDYTSKSESAVIDLNEAVGASPESAAYATTEFASREARDAEIRLGCFTAFKLWVNGELVLVRGDAFTGMRADHYVARVRLRPGANTILLKIAQDVPPPQVPPPNHWRFVLRVCDASGAALKPADDKK
jgi:hypothetical protein